MEEVNRMRGGIRKSRGKAVREGVKARKKEEERDGEDETEVKGRKEKGKRKGEGRKARSNGQV